MIETNGLRLLIKEAWLGKEVERGTWYKQPQS